MSNVFVLDTNKQALHPVHPGRARRLLSSGNDASGEVVFAASLIHRGDAIRERLEKRRAARRSRRQRKSRYRQPRCDNRGTKKKGWIAPSVQSRVCNVITWVKRLVRLCPITAISQELVKFDLQQMDNPEISGVNYQQGTLSGYEVREYLLDKWGRQCAYCGARDVPLEVEHINPRRKSGDDRVCNLTLACEPCNSKKGTQDIRVFLAHQPELLAKLLAQAKSPLKDAATVNITRWVLHAQLKAFGLPLECGSGGRTKFNRITRGLEKTHWWDAACVGASTPEVLHIGQVRPLGRMSAKASGAFTIATAGGTVTDIGKKYCRMLQRADGYGYTQKGEVAFPPVA